MSPNFFKALIKSFLTVGAEDGDVAAKKRRTRWTITARSIFMVDINRSCRTVIMGYPVCVKFLSIVLPLPTSLFEQGIAYVFLCNIASNTGSNGQQVRTQTTLEHPPNLRSREPLELVSVKNMICSAMWPYGFISGEVC